MRADSQPGHHICGRLPSVSAERLHTCTWWRLIPFRYIVSRELPVKVLVSVTVTKVWGEREGGSPPAG